MFGATALILSSSWSAWPITRLQYMLAGSRRPCHAVSELHSHRCGVKTAVRRRHGGRWSLKGESTYACRSASSLLYAGTIPRFYACCLVMAVTSALQPRRRRASQSTLWSHNGGATDATVGGGRSMVSRPAHEYQHHYYGRCDR